MFRLLKPQRQRLQFCSSSCSQALRAIVDQTAIVDSGEEDPYVDFAVQLDFWPCPLGTMAEITQRNYPLHPRVPTSTELLVDTFMMLRASVVLERPLVQQVRLCPNGLPAQITHLTFELRPDGNVAITPAETTSTLVEEWLVHTRSFNLRSAAALMALNCENIDH